MILTKKEERRERERKKKGGGGVCVFAKTKPVSYQVEIGERTGLRERGKKAGHRWEEMFPGPLSFPHLPVFPSPSLLLSRTTRRCAGGGLQRLCQEGDNGLQWRRCSSSVGGRGGAEVGEARDIVVELVG